MSKKDGTEPVVIAFNRGIVTVGALACAVNGKAFPIEMRLFHVSSFIDDFLKPQHLPLREIEP